MAAAVNVLGEEFLVNTTVSGPQGAPTITTLANGNFLIAFGNGGQSSSAPGDTSSVLAQILTPTGQKVGGELWIDQSIIGSQYQPHISPLSAGGFVATWHDVRAVDDENFSWSFRSRVFDAIGRQTGPDIVLENAQDGGHVASLANGNFVLSWSDMAGGGHAQLFSSSGTPLGPRSDLVGDLNWGVDVTALADGGFVTSTMRVSNGGWIIEGQKFNPAGQAVGSSFIIRNAGEHDVLGHATAATSNGGFVTVWAEFDHGRQDIKLQLFDANSAAVGTPIIANLTDETYNEEPEVAVLDDGTVLVTWQRFSYYYDIRGNQINNGSGLTAQRFSENGVKIGSEIWIDDTKVTKYTTSAVTAAAHGGYAITWTDSSGTLGDSGSDGAVKARIYGPNSIPQITSGNGELASYQVRENVNAVARVTADDADANAKLAFKITGGSDASFFTIDPTTGALAFKALPNLADPTHNAFYDLTVQVSDGYAADQQAIKVQVIPATAGGIQWTGTAGGDTIGGTEFDDLLDGAGGDDLLYGGRGNDHLLGGEGNDKLSGGGELDVLNGGSGDDTFLVRSTLETIVEAIGQGNDTIETDLSGYVLPDNVEDLLYTGVAAFNGTGNSLRNALAGGRGSDRLDGLAGADIMKGGDGNDTYVVDHAVDIVFEIAGQGTDRVLAKVSHTLSANVENLTLTSGASINGTGNAQSNIILGNGGVNFLNGRGGADSLTGGASNDTFIFQRGEADSDIVTDFTGAATAGGDLLNFTGYGAGAYLTHVANSDLYEIHAGTAYGGATETIRLLGVTNLGGGDYLIDGLAGGELGVDHSGDDIY
ncbi:MAG: cadherin domain-containing protein, partial [Sphingobium sp.]